MDLKMFNLEWGDYSGFSVLSYYYTKQNYYVGFEVLMAVSMKISVFWVVAPCSLVEDSNLQNYYDFDNGEYRTMRSFMIAMFIK
jgi:hypothetical protein